MAVVALVGVAACGGTAQPTVQVVQSGATEPAPSTSTGSSSLTASAALSSPAEATVQVPTLPALEDAIPQAADDDVALVHELQADAGIAALLGPSGQAALAGIDDSETQFAATDFPGLAQQTGLPSGSNGFIASIGAFTEDWEPSFLARSGYTISMITGFLAGMIELSDGPEGYPKQTEGKTENWDKTTDGIHEHTTTETTWTIELGGGKMSVDVELVARTTATDASTGAAVGNMTSTGNGHIDLNGCPDSQGHAEGKISMSWQEQLDRSGQPGAIAGMTIDAPITLIDGDDAHLIETDINLGYTKDASGPGAPGSAQPAPFSWDVGGSMQVVIPASSKSIDVSGVTAQGHATDAQTRSATSAALTQASLIVIQVAAEAEKFWRGGHCIELKPSEDSQDVDPGEQLQFSVDASHKWDGSQIKAPITASFSGVKSVEPADQPVDPPASFTYTAGQNPGDVGTVNLKQTSRRGIGMKTLAFTVNENVTLQMDGSYRLSNVNFTVTVPKGKMLRQPDGTYEMGLNADVSGSAGFGGCSKSFADTVGMTITVTLDDADTTKATLRVELDDSGLLQIPIKCNGISTLLPVPVNLWAGSFSTPSGPVTVAVGTPTTVTGTAGSKGASTVVGLERQGAQ